MSNEWNDALKYAASLCWAVAEEKATDQTNPKLLPSQQAFAMAWVRAADRCALKILNRMHEDGPTEKPVTRMDLMVTANERFNPQPPDGGVIDNPVYVYVAGPYSIGNTVHNVQTAVLAAERIREINRRIVPFIPHLSMLWDLASPHDYGYWLAQCLAWVERVDAVFRLPGRCPGCEVEVDHARRHAKPVFTEMKSFAAWAETRLSMKVVTYPMIEPMDPPVRGGGDDD